MKVIFYKQQSSNRYPVYDFIKTLRPEDRLKILACLKSVEDLGFACPRVQFRQINRKLWEIKIKSTYGSYRIFYVTITQTAIVLLHAYRKQSQKSPKKVIAIAIRRMVEVLDNEALYNT